MCLERWERRNADTARVVEHEFLVHAKIHENEKDKEGEKTLMWMAPAAIFMVPGMDRETFDNMFEAFEEAREEARAEALSAFDT